MSVKRRVESIFPVCKNSWSYEFDYYQKSKSPKFKFRPRVKELLVLEGKYDNPSFPDYPIRISCRFNDILRCSDTEHFTSCFRAGGMEKKQPFLRCVSRDWAIAFVTDKHGNFMGRIWIRYVSGTKSSFYNEPESIYLYRVYGNKLREEDVRSILTKSLISQLGRQVLINGGLSDDYLPF